MLNQTKNYIPAHRMPDNPSAQTFDLIVVGTSFSASFFLHRYLKRSPPATRVLVLERGPLITHRQQLDGGRSPMWTRANDSYINRTPEKEWAFVHAFGGNSSCWAGSTPRMLPDDFRLRSRFGVGVDWPVSYDELEAYYCDAEDMMSVAGPPNDDSPFPRSRPYPQPPHRYNDVDRMFKRAYPDQVFVAPTARPTRATANRPACCNNGRCSLCPIDSKFSILNEMHELYRDPRITLLLGASVQAIDVQGGALAKGVRYLAGGSERTAAGDLVVLAANAIFNPHILLRSGIEHSELGRGLGEQVGSWVILHLDGVDNYGGSTAIVGHWYGLHGPETRPQRAAAIVELNNRPQLRMERGKYRQIAHLRVAYEDLREPGNRVTINADDPSKPEVVYQGHSEYAERGRQALMSELERRLATLPVEEIFIKPAVLPTELHIQGTVVMGDDPRTSVVDAYSVHHTVRNLLVLGSSNFPTAATADPTLTLSALALRSADYVLNSARTN